MLNQSYRHPTRLPAPDREEAPKPASTLTGFVAVSFERVNHIDFVVFDAVVVNYMPNQLFQRTIKSLSVNTNDDDPQIASFSSFLLVLLFCRTKLS